ncbi:MAG: type IV secretory system conjugative DNA transfer family protein [Campylobacterales bacterium]|nr:type IV secretory system conjugative DNA transfer family protein [Campylobacterales bacterium]
MRVGLIKNQEITPEIPLVDVKFTHSLCIGQTGSGKTSSFVYPNLLNRLKLGHGVLFFDIKGSEHKAIKKLAKDVNRLQDVLEVGKPWGENINILKDFNSRTFSTLLTSLVGDPKDAGQNAYFYNAAIALGLNIFNILKLCSIISKEIRELGIEVSFELYEFFSFSDLYKASLGINNLYDFLQEKKSFQDAVFEIIKTDAALYLGKNKELYKNIVLNYANLKSQLANLQKYDVPQKKRNDREKFDLALIPVIHSLSEAFSFMVTPAAKYISQKDNPFDIVQSLQDGKIVIINVRVIPDAILELMLDQLFEKLIDLNLVREEHRHPTSIFIDEAQRLINKNIPLDILRSSKIDVILAVQSELQLISKFGSKEDWQQISVNIADKYAYRSSFFGGDHLASFYIDTATLNPFEYAKEHDTNIKKAIPIFMDKDELDFVELKYQHEVLKLSGLTKNELFQYDVTHFENEREVLIFNIKTMKKQYKKLFTSFEDNLIFSIIEKFVPLPLETLINKVGMTLSQNLWNHIYNEFHICSEEQFNKLFIGAFPSLVEVCNFLLLKLDTDDEEYEDISLNLLGQVMENHYDDIEILKDEELDEDDIPFDEPQGTIISINSKKAQQKLEKVIDVMGFLYYEADSMSCLLFKDADKNTNKDKSLIEEEESGF